MGSVNGAVQDFDKKRKMDGVKGRRILCVLRLVAKGIHSIVTQFYSIYLQ